MVYICQLSSEFFAFFQRTVFAPCTCRQHLGFEFTCHNGSEKCVINQLWRWEPFS